MMISKRVNANAPTLERSPRFARLRSCVYKYKYPANNLFPAGVVRIEPMTFAQHEGCGFDSRPGL